MKAFMYEGTLCLLTEDNEWSCSDQLLRQSMEIRTNEWLARYSPADGIPRFYIFAKMVELLKPTDIVDDEIHQGPPADFEGEQPVY